MPNSNPDLQIKTQEILSTLRVYRSTMDQIRAGLMDCIQYMDSMAPIEREIDSRIRSMRTTNRVDQVKSVAQAADELIHKANRLPGKVSSLSSYVSQKVPAQVSALGDVIDTNFKVEGK